MARHRGFEDTVVPQLERALIAGHDVVLLGERGQGKTRLLRTLTGLLDEWTPVIAGSELGEHPLRADHARSRSAGPPNSGDDLPVAWRHRSERYAEKLATPDTSVGRPVGDVDPVKVAEGRSLGDPETIHFGLDPARAPRHRRDQRAARPRRAHPGVAAQRDGGARHPGPRLHAAAAAGRAARRQRQPGGLHQPRPHHHPAQGPLRRRDPHALPAAARRRGRRHPPGGGPDRRGARYLLECSPGSPGTARVDVDRPALRCVGALRGRRGGNRRGRRACTAARFWARRTRWPGRSTSARSSRCCAASWNSSPARRAASRRCSSTCCAGRPPTPRSGLGGIDLGPLVAAVEEGDRWRPVSGYRPRRAGRAARTCR